MICSQSYDVEVKVAPNRIWCALFEDSHNFLPNNMPHKIAAVQYEGKACEVGSIRSIKFHEGYGLTEIKQKIEEVDREKMYVKFSMLKGGLASMFKDAKLIFQMREGVEPGTAVVTSRIEYEGSGKEEIPVDGKEKAAETIKAVEAYLLATNEYA